MLPCPEFEQSLLSDAKVRMSSYLIWTWEIVASFIRIPGDCAVVCQKASLWCKNTLMSDIFKLKRIWFYVFILSLVLEKKLSAWFTQTKSKIIEEYFLKYRSGRKTRTKVNSFHDREWKTIEIPKNSINRLHSIRY